MATSELCKLARVAVISAGVTFFTTSELVMVAEIEGDSMQPTFNPTHGQTNEDLRLLSEQGLTREMMKRKLVTRLRRDWVLFNKWVARDKTKLKIGDVVILTSPRNPNKRWVKRITALPGDAIQLIETGETKVIDEGHCWVEGDNQRSSFDSNIFGQVPLGLIQGRVHCIVWPLNRIRKIDCDSSISLNSSKTKLLGQIRQSTR